MSLVHPPYDGPMPQTADGAIPDHVKCAQCRQLLKEACLITNCGCRLCEYHLTDEFFVDRDFVICPGETEDCDRILKDEGWIPDKATRRTVLGLKIVCPNNDSDGTNCGYVCRFRDLPTHFGGCKFSPEGCSYCNKDFPRIRLTEHEEVCPKRPIICEFCRKQMIQGDRSKHLDWQSDSPCEQHRWNCPYCTKKSLLASELRRHQEECDKWPQMCQFHAIGCQFTGDDMEAHLKTNVSEHQALLLVAVINEKDALLKENTELKKINADLNAECLTLRQNVEKMKTEYDAPLKKMRNVQMVLANCRERQLEIEKVLEKHGSIDTIMQRFEQTRNARAAGNGNGLTALPQHGTFLWRIDNFRDCKAAAESGTNPSILSPPFLTEPYGYKMCCRLYPNGDGSGKGTHLSLFIVIMKSEHDSILRWPFSQRVTLKLMDQSDHERHLSETFCPDQRSNSFKRPVEDMNVASGCPRFVPLLQLEGSAGQYLRDDTIFIQVIIEKNQAAR